MCYTPLFVNNKTYKKKGQLKTEAVPCGKCYDCIRRKVVEWMFRIMQEEKVADTTNFITLTYENGYLPISVSKRGYIQPTLNKDHLQKWFKRLRKAHSYRAWFTRMKKKNRVRVKSRNGKWKWKYPPMRLWKRVEKFKNVKIRYYAVGEYGGRTKRPHYHIVLFNAKRELVEKTWNMGSVHYGEVNTASIAYTANYVIGRSNIGVYDYDMREKQFAVMSKGIGKNYLNGKLPAWHRKVDVDRAWCLTIDGRKISMPRYYRDKIYSELQKKRIAFFNSVKQIEKLLEWEAIPVKLQRDILLQKKQKLDKNEKCKI